jgi:hypothetical protein
MKRVRENLQLNLKKSGGTTFNEEWGCLEMMHAKNREFGARKKWEEVTLFNLGRVTVED